MSSPCPRLNLHFDCTNSCNQVHCCSRDSRSKLDNDTVIYNPSENELTNEPPGTSLLGYLFFCCFRNKQREAQLQQTIEAIEAHLLSHYAVRLEEAGRKCHFCDDLLKGKQRIRVRDFKQLEKAAHTIAEEKQSSGDSSIHAPEISWRKEPSLKRHPTPKKQESDV